MQRAVTPDGILSVTLSSIPPPSPPAANNVDDDVISKERLDSCTAMDEDQDVTANDIARHL